MKRVEVGVVERQPGAGKVNSTAVPEDTTRENDRFRYELRHGLGPYARHDRQMLRVREADVRAKPHDEADLKVVGVPLRQNLHAHPNRRPQADQDVREVADIRLGAVGRRPDRQVVRDLIRHERLKLGDRAGRVQRLPRGVDDELPGHLRDLVVFGSGTGLMPEEWIALRARDVSIPFGVVTVERTFSEGVLTDYGKTSGRRRVPLRARVVEAIRDRVEGLAPEDLVFPGRDGGFIPLRSFRRNDWSAALIGAGFFDAVEDAEGKTIQKPNRTPYAMRHTYAAFSLAAGVNPYTLARRMGTLVAMIDRTYGHPVPDADAAERKLLDDYDEQRANREQTPDDVADRI